MGRYTRRFAFSLAAVTVIGGATPADATILVEIRTIGADVKADEVRFEKDFSGEPVVVFSMPSSPESALLLEHVMNDGELEGLTVLVRDAEFGTEIQYEIDRAWVKSWSISGDADDRPMEEVAFYYNKMHPVWEPTGDGRK